MRHRKRTAKLGMKSQHRRATLANLVCSLIAHNRITTTVARAKEVRRHADKMVTLAKKADATDDPARKVHLRRQALAFLRQNDVVKKLFAEIAKQHADRQGGYTRVIRVGPRAGDAAERAILEWTGAVVPVATEAPKETGKKQSKKTEKTEEKK